VKQAPSWNKVVESFAGNTDVAFGDVALSENQVRKIHDVDQNPGAGGWPTIRHFNKETGYGGKAYAKKTDQAMCDELGPKEEYMQEFVEEQGGVSLCSIKKPEVGCTDKQKDFINKWSVKPADDISKQRDRLQLMLGKDSSSMKPETLKWAKQRANIFKQLSQKEEL